MSMSEIDAAVAEPTIVCTLPSGERIIVPLDVCTGTYNGTEKTAIVKTEQMRQYTLERLPALVNGLTNLTQAEKNALQARLEAAIAAPIADGGGVL